MVVLVLTATIQPRKYLQYAKLKNPKVRLKEYEDTLEWALGLSNIDRIIFLENSSYEYDFTPWVDRFNTEDTFFTVVRVPESYYENKGVGELELLKSAIPYINSSDLIIKLTGRVRLPELDKFISEFKDNKPRFKYDPNHRTVKLKTFVFSMKGEDYINVFSDMEMKDSLSTSFEWTLEKRLEKLNIKYVDFPSMPVDGINASSLKPYEL